ncbi:MAG: PE family protein [Mycobacteriaceae bacterium]|nr:PE family protein [Mycobacteriaceae bacterium]
MSFVSVTPELVVRPRGIWTTLGRRASRCQGGGVGLDDGGIGGGRDEVSAAISALFGAHGQQFQALNVRPSKAESIHSGRLR